MRKLSLMITSILVLGWAAVQGQTSTETATELQQNTTEQVQMEEYVPKVIIEGKWGTGPGEFGVGVDYQILPQKITVDNRGNIFILDTANNRIQKFDKNGEYLFSIPIKSFQGNWYYDSNGMPLAGSIEKYNTDMCIDSNNNLYFLNIPQKGKRKIGVYKNGKNLEKAIFVEKEKIESIFINDNGNLNITEEVGNIRQVFEVRSSTEIKVFKEMRKDKNGNIFLPPESIAKNKWRIPVIDKDKKSKDIIIETDKDISSVEFLRRDGKGDIYARVCANGEFVYKYSPQLKLLTRVKEYRWTENTFFSSPMVVDNSGNIYQLVVEHPTTMVIKWEKKK